MARKAKTIMIVLIVVFLMLAGFIIYTAYTEIKFQKAEWQEKAAQAYIKIYFASSQIIFPVNLIANSTDKHES
jgi:flagellar basal body-associated protein FliL